MGTPEKYGGHQYTGVDAFDAFVRKKYETKKTGQNIECGKGQH